MSAIDLIIENRMREAQALGQMDNNPLAGQAINLDDYFRAPKDSRAINKYLKDQGFVPPKIQLMRELNELENQYRHNRESDLRDKIQALQLKINML